MRKALKMLDRMGETDAACRLQSAIDTLQQNRPMQPGDEIDDELAALIAAIPLERRRGGQTKPTRELQALGR
ncbi:MULTISPECIES: hypothetical protein [unclassified Sphingomonas]|uniref:hypothetical protein n=1 Tax=unclassified Sphingomonas TaxID=196159 RepID=UPI0025FECB56|nr:MULTISPECIES: hypothetical protein [unclassified Sphingomonas]